MVHAPISVDFYVYASHEIAVWEPIWTALRRRGVDAQFVVEPPGLNRARGSVPDGKNGWRDDKAGDSLAELMNDDMFERTVTALHGLELPWIEESRTDADVVITTSGSGWLGHYRGQKVRTMYGVGAVTDSYGHGPVNAGLDGVLVHGPFSAHAIAAHVAPQNIHQTGFPKWAAARRGGLDVDEYRRQLGIETDGRPIVAWLPTWAHNSSIDGFGDALAELSKDHRVLAKPHHNNLRFERARLDAIAPEVELLEGLPSLVPLVLAADIVVGDVRSGGVTEALLADRPVVGLVPSGDVEAQNLLTGVDEAITLCPGPHDLRAAITRSQEQHRAGARYRWARWFFGPMAGDDDERAADAVLAIASRGRNRLRIHVGADDLDRHVREIANGTASLDSAQVVQLAWPSWPGDPRLVDLLKSMTEGVDVSTLAACARGVRATGHGDLCPIRAVALDGSSRTDRRIAASALGSVLFSDERCTETFFELCREIAEEELEPSLVMLLTHEPEVVPAFVAAAGSTPRNRDRLVELLTAAGADAVEVEALLSTG